MSSAQNIIARVAAEKLKATELQRAQTYVKAKKGYQKGFLPPGVSPVMRAKTLPDADRTAPLPSEAALEKKQSQGEIAVWRRKVSEIRRTNMRDFLTRQIIAAKEKPARDTNCLNKGRRAREAQLNAPNSGFETMSLPSIESMMIEEYPLKSIDTEMRERQATRNREKKLQKDHKARLHQYLTLHHNAADYATSLEALDSLLDKTIGAYSILDVSSAFNHFQAHRTGARTKEIQREVFNAILGTAGNKEPGVLEVSQVLKENAAEAPTP